MKFICDQMLINLGKWLRIAGYDTLIILDGLSDIFIEERAVKEDRYLLTKDKHFLNEGVKKIVYIKSVRLHSCVEELTQKLEVNWLFNPLSRCLICNTELIEVNQSEIPDKLKSFDEVVKCPHCLKYYWHGSHYKAMVEQLTKWQNHEWN
ncbi:MAG: hypothetical protein COT84_06010 [Chlamydiae bacterium CG10_big_fil_rev_8_21_14_0_10_35_9]|nr:MAG: hypothetical protein COT84_06010 [Chlamydiae bacterium CG10_big_fil_rev_8_21_14_0_10_35_9]